MLTNRIRINKASSFIVYSLSFVYKKKKEEKKEERRNMLLSNNLKYGGVTPPHGSLQYPLINTVIYTNLVLLGVETHVPICQNTRNNLQEYIDQPTSILRAAKNHISTMKDNKIKAIDSSELVKDTATTYQHNRSVYRKRQNFVIQDGKIISPTVKKTNGKFTKQTQLG